MERGIVFIMKNFKEIVHSNHDELYQFFLVEQLQHQKKCSLLISDRSRKLSHSANDRSRSITEVRSRNWLDASRKRIQSSIRLVRSVIVYGMHVITVSCWCYTVIQTSFMPKPVGPTAKYDGSRLKRWSQVQSLFIDKVLTRVCKCRLILY